MLDVCWWGGSGCPLKSKGEKKKGPGGGYDVLKELRNNVDKSVEGGKKLVWWSSQLIPNVNLLSLACEWLSRLRLSAANQNHWAVHETSGVSHEQGKRCCDGWLSSITFREMFPAVLKPGRETFCLYTTLCCLFPGCQLGTLIPCNVTQLCEFSATSPPVIVSLAVHQIKHDSRQSKYTNPNDCAAPQLTTDDQRQGLWSSEYWGATYRVITTPVTLTDKKKKPSPLHVREQTGQCCRGHTGSLFVAQVFLKGLRREWIWVKAVTGLQHGVIDRAEVEGTQEEVLTKVEKRWGCLRNTQEVSATVRSAVSVGEKNSWSRFKSGLSSTCELVTKTRH